MPNQRTSETPAYGFFERRGDLRARVGRLNPLSIIPVLILVAGCACQPLTFLNFEDPAAIVTPDPSGPTTPTQAPSVTPTQPLTATPTQAPAATPTQAPPTTPTVQPPATPSQARPATQRPIATATLPASAELESVCIFIHHDGLGDFVSYFDFAMWWIGVDFFDLELTIKEANNDAPIQLVLNPDGSWRGQYGFNETGTKEIVSLIAHFPDGSQLDLTQDLINHLGSDEFNVRRPQEDVLGC